MREITVDYRPIYLGKRGEDNAARVHFPVKSWFDTYGAGGTFTLLVQRYGDEAPYPVVTEVVDNEVLWVVDDADMANVGYGCAELNYAVNGTLAKSQTWQTVVEQGLGEPGEAPEPYQAWVEDVVQAAADIKGMTVDVETLEPGEEATATYEDGNMHFGIPKGEKGDTGATGAKGDTGATGPQGPQGPAGQDAEVDPTLTQEGQAADAKATGDALRSLSSDKVNKDQGVVQAGKFFQVNAQGMLVPVDLPIASTSQLGAVMIGNGLQMAEDKIFTKPASTGNIDARTAWNLIDSSVLDYAVKAAMCDGVGTAWTYMEQYRAEKRLIRKWELVVDETLTEDVTKFEAVIDSTKMYSEIRIEAQAPESMTIGSAFTTMQIYYQDYKFLQFYAGGQRWFGCKLKIFGDYWEGYVQNFQYENYSHVTTMLSTHTINNIFTSSVADDPTNSIRKFVYNGAVSSGTRFKIWCR